MGVIIPGAPGSPINLTATPGNAKVTLTWTAPTSNGGSAILGYKLYRGTSSGGETLYATLGNVLTVVNSKNIVNGVTYYYKVSAFNSAGPGPLSNELSATPTAGATVPSAPALVSAVAGNAKVTLTWTAPTSNGGSAILGYRLYRGTTAGGETLYATIGNVLTVVNSKNIVNGVTYYYKIAAYNAIGQGPLSNELSAKPSALLAVVAAASSPLPLHQQGISIINPTSAVDAGQFGWTTAATAGNAIQAGTSIISDRNAWRSTY
jgi:predicted phage tail protein